MPERSGRRGAVRLSDVAKRAQCSAATVSRVLNAPATVNPEARARVEAAVRELGYMRDGAARALRSGRSQTIGLILPTIRMPVYAVFIETLQEALAETGYSLIVMASQFSLDREADQGRLLMERGVDGLVLIGRTHRPVLYALMAERRIPFVQAYTWAARSRHPTIGFDNAAAMAQVIDYLHDLGHRRFALATATTGEDDRLSDRVAGAIAALEAHGTPLTADRIFVEEFSIKGGHDALERVLAHESRPTAIVCTTDIQALGVMNLASHKGIAVPRDMSVTGFDNLEPGRLLRPSLTTVQVPMTEMARRIATYMAARVGGEPDDPGDDLPALLCRRDSTAPPPRIEAAAFASRSPRFAG